MNRKKLKVVVDTNLYISGFIVPRGKPHLLLKSLRESQFTSLLSPSLFIELKGVLSRPKYQKIYRITNEDILLVLQTIKNVSKKVVPLKKLPLTVRNAKDEKVLKTALGGNADYLVTGDKDLLILNDNKLIKPLKIITVDEFLKLVG